MTIGWGIVGTGRVADTSVAPGIAKLADAELVASVGRDPAKAREFAAQHGGRAYDTYEELLADDAVDVVYVATPNALHAEQVVAAARAGKHVFADKPLATSVADAERALAACDDAGVKLGVNFQTRHHEGIAEVVQALRDRAVGDVLIVECEVSPGVGPLRGWRSDPQLAGLGTINNLGVHAYDLLRYLTGAEVVEVTALTNVGQGDELETIALALLRFADGTLGYVNANQAVPDYRPDLAIYGSEGRILGSSVTRPFIEQGSFSILSGGEERTIQVQSRDAFDRSVAAFNHAVARDLAPNASGLDGLRSVQLTDALARSAREGRTVRVVA
jgi:predicted dehydrogenase